MKDRTPSETQTQGRSRIKGPDGTTAYLRVAYSIEYADSADEVRYRRRSHWNERVRIRRATADDIKQWKVTSS